MEEGVCDGCVDEVLLLLLVEALANSPNGSLLLLLAEAVVGIAAAILVDVVVSEYQSFDSYLSWMNFNRSLQSLHVDELQPLQGVGGGLT